MVAESISNGHPIKYVNETEGEANTVLHRQEKDDVV